MNKMHDIDKALAEIDAMPADIPSTPEPFRTKPLPLLTELAIAEHFAGCNRGRTIFVPELGEWLCLNPETMIWQADSATLTRYQTEMLRALRVLAAGLHDADARRAALRFLDRMETARAMRDVLQLALKQHGMALEMKNLNAGRLLLPVVNGVIDLRDGSFRTARAEDYLTHIVPVEYRPDATCPRWDAFLLWAMAGREDLVAFLRRAVGMTLAGEVRDHVFLFLYGHGRNGKSTLINLLIKMLGPLHRRLTSASLMVTDKNHIPNDIARLAGARCVTASEIEDGARLNESLIKDLTGGDVIPARFLHREFFEFLPQLTLWLVGNHRPVIRGTDAGIWRRVMLVPFEATLADSEVDPDLSAKLEAELPGILNWAISGCIEWRESGLNPPEAVRAATDAYRTEQDILGQFIAEMCVTGAGNCAGAAELYKAYERWAQDSGLRPQSKVRFSNALQERGYERSRTSKGTKYAGIRIATGYDHAVL